MERGTTIYRYSESGLQNVWLANGYKTRKVAGGKAVAILDADGLHRAIGRSIACKAHLTGAELRFLRKELDLSQVRLGPIVGASEESVSLWERRGKIPKSTARLIQALYMETIDGNVHIRDLLARLSDLDRVEQTKLVFEDTASGWKEAA